MAPSVIFLMADNGHDPTEVSIPWQTFSKASFDVSFATENGTQPACDPAMLQGVTGALLGANAAAKAAYTELQSDAKFQRPQSWSDPSFTLKTYDLVFLPGGHEKSVRQIIDSTRVHSLLAEYFPLTRRALQPVDTEEAKSPKCIAAICHGVQVLSSAHYPSTADTPSSCAGKSLLYDTKTTALISSFESTAYNATRLFLGDYYKTYGAGTPNVEEYVRREIDEAAGGEFVSNTAMAPFYVEDPTYRYLSGRWPGDADLLAEKTVELVKKTLEGGWK